MERGFQSRRENGEWGKMLELMPLRRPHKFILFDKSLPLCLGMN